MKTLVFRGFHKANVEKHMGFEALNGNPGPKHCVLPHFLGGGGEEGGEEGWGKRAFWGPWGRRDGVRREKKDSHTLDAEGSADPKP